MRKANKIAMAAMLLTGGLSLQAQETADSTALVLKADTIIYDAPLLTTKIHAAVRTYGDSIMLRWVPEDYASWKYLCDYGVNVLRVEKGSIDLDTLAMQLKPLSLEAFQAKYAPNDSNALVAMGLLYGENRLKRGQTMNRPGTLEASMEFNTEQDISFAFAMLVAEWRRDLAQDMAVGFMDRSVKAGAVYEYYVQPSQWENGGAFIFEPGVVENVENVPYVPEPYEPQMTDTLTTPRRHVLGWWDDRHSSYEIERRFLDDGNGDGPWERINTKPYVSMIEQPQGASYLAFADSVPQFGIYEYRIMAHDPFGELTAPSPALRINVYDTEPPRAPQLTRILLEYPGETLTEKVMAHFCWQKDTIEADVNGYIIYYNEQGEDGEWLPLNDDLISPTDSTTTIDVTGRKTCMVYIAAVDQSGNEAPSFAQLLELHDYQAPAAPDSLRAQVVPLTMNQLIGKGGRYSYVLLDWKPKPEDTDIRYYDVAFANDTTHVFLLRNEGGIRERMFLDSLVLDANQKYIYYQVRAVDHSNNIGPWSPWIEVKRPHITPPTEPHIDTSRHSDEEGMHMEWIVGMDADMDYHVAYRRRGDSTPWEVIGRYDADSLRAYGYRIIIDDNPPFDREQRYYYYVESFNSSPYTAKSLAISWMHQGPKVVAVDFDLAGDYMEKEKQTRLVWSPGKLPIDAPYYYCIYRKGPGDEKFRFVVSVPSDQPEYTDQLLRQGQSAEYYVMIQWRDGRQSTASKVVKISRP